MNMAAKPNCDNVAQSEQLEHAMQIVLKTDKGWSTKKPQLQQDILMFHHVQLETAYTRLVEARDKRVPLKCLVFQRKTDVPSAPLS